MSELLLIALTAAVVSNTWLARSAYASTRAFDVALPVAGTVWLICTLAFAADAAARLLFPPRTLTHFAPLFSSVVCAALAVLMTHLPVRARALLAAELWLVTAAAALLTIAVRHAVESRGIGLAPAIVGAGAVFGAALALLGALTERLERTVPDRLREPALRLAAAALLSLAFMGFAGIGGL